MFRRLKDWRRIAMRNDRCAHTLFSAITFAVTVIFWLGQSVLSLALCTNASLEIGLIGREHEPSDA
jgi:hypothetical protein